MNAVTITRTERVMLSGQLDPIDTMEFTCGADAEAHLRGMVGVLRDEHFAGILAHEQTSFEHREMVYRGASAYLGTVIYEIEVEK